jgi:hypothetical protein
VTAGGVGLRLAYTLEPSAISLVATGALTTVLLVAGLLLTARSTLIETVRLLRSLTSRGEATV